MKDFEIRCDASHLEISNNNNSHILYGKFTLGPFLPGQGTTFGNALRRSLLSELSGLAITAFEILGIMQEFSILPGLRESILDLSLNLKQVVLTGVLPHSIPPIGFLKRKGPAIIKAMDLKLPAGVFCTSPDQYIATLSSNGDLNLKFIISVGKGYSVQPYSLYRSLSKIKLQPTFEVLRNSFTEGKTAYSSTSEGGVAYPSNPIPRTEYRGTRNTGVIAIPKEEAQLPTDTEGKQGQVPVSQASTKLFLPLRGKCEAKSERNPKEYRTSVGSCASSYGITVGEQNDILENSNTRSDPKSINAMQTSISPYASENKNISKSEYISSAPKHIRSNSTNFSDAHSASYLRAAFTSDCVAKVISPTDAENQSQQSKEEQNNTPLCSQSERNIKLDTKGSLRAFTNPKSMQLYPKGVVGMQEVIADPERTKYSAGKRSISLCSAYPYASHEASYRFPAYAGKKHRYGSEAGGEENVGSEASEVVSSPFAYPSNPYASQARAYPSTSPVRNTGASVGGCTSYDQSMGMHRGTLPTVCKGVRRSTSRKTNNNKSINQLEGNLSSTSLKTATNTTFAYQTYIHSSEGHHPNILAENRRGFDIQTQIFQRVNPHQVLPIDAVFTPVSRVNFLTQVNDRFETARENIVLEIWTNGSIHPKKALEEATLLLVQNFDTLLKKIQQASSISKGVHYVNYLQTPVSLSNRTGPRLPSKNAEESANNKRNALHIEDLRSKEAVTTPKVTIQGDSTGIKRVEKKGVTYFEQPSSADPYPERTRYSTGKNMQEFPKKYLHQAVFNLDIGNFNLSLQTFIALKEAKIHTLSQLLTLFSLEDKKFNINLPQEYAILPSKVEGSESERNLLLKEKIVDELKNVIHHFIH